MSINKDSQKAPKLRFKGFTDDWEQRKLINVVDRVTRRNTNLQSKTPLTISAQFGLVDQITYFSKQVASKNMENYFLLYNGDFAYNKSYSKGYPFGAIKRLDSYDSGALSTLYIVFRPNIVDSNFLVHYFETTKWYTEIIKISAEGARNHGLLNITSSDFFDIKLCIPSKSVEQEKIGTLINYVENIIRLHQRKLDQLNQLKEALLQQMFPGKGETVPKLRFAGFEGDWEERKLSSMTMYKNGKSHEEKQSTSGKYELINLNSISISGGLKHSGKFIEDTNDTLQKDDLVMILSDVGHGDLLGRVALIPNDNKFVLNQRVALLRPNETADPHFLFSYINAHQHYFKSQGAGMSQLNISKGSVENFTSNVPTIQEQNHIGTFFKSLDNIIVLYQGKLEQLQNMKQVLLQNMFI